MGQQARLTRRQFLRGAAGWLALAAFSYSECVLLEKGKHVTSLPKPLIGAYFPCYDNACPSLANTPTDPNGVTGYNTIFIFQVLPSGVSGKLSFDCSAVQSQASLKADIAAKRAAGICVLLTFGGSGGYLAISSRAVAATFLSSLEAIIAAVGPVDGLDWDIEGGALYPAQMTWIGQQLKARYGPGFAITMAPGPWDTAAAAAAKTMYAGGALDVAGPQFYEQGALSTAEMIANVSDRITNIWLPAVGGNRDALVLGFELAAADETSVDLMSTVTAVKSWAGAAPLRGAFVWNSSVEHANGGLFVNGVAPAIVGKTPVPAPTPTPPPAPPPAPPPHRHPPHRHPPHRHH